ncbi:putative retrovirus-related pol polyprotein from transposon opus [Trichonephila inaurata madagascariensis]|uniref:Putative retrovirus-related pol polyprotein from transposon opus n=1 Tax=Trichonephila inaurata madagascariensis TaxID=2747483 RepID=A0A8X7BX08_9ARAC|nr:putative retrovirus-related pol polyprotein from transposon opus [Trichonephila inaurata madagascariensis]
MSRCWGPFHHRVNDESSSGFTPQRDDIWGFCTEIMCFHSRVSCVRACRDDFKIMSHSGAIASVEITFDGNRPPLTICSLAVAQVPPVSLFSNLNADCRPLVTKSRRHTVEDNNFMAFEVQKLLQEGVTEPSNSAEGSGPFSLGEKIISLEWWFIP